MRNVWFLSLAFLAFFSQSSYAMVKCPFCHFENEDGALFCEQCKSDLSTTPSGVTSLQSDTNVSAGSDGGARLHSGAQSNIVPLFEDQIR
ncbi:MAG: hypothetical protein HYR96_00875 [Deltaproteobacteria bacterium]|nr:hypothetical protein [Deltaproteobacteria bacterium]MBI3296079.1 hypothetical protein [Deltaproteobacteria bacterium]